MVMVTMAESLSHSLHTFRIPPPPSPNTPLLSPKRRQQLPVEEDPLLGKLSPEAILDALAAINAVSKHERHAKDLLTRSISQVSPEDRALGARAAIAAKKLREWLKELQAWPWPKGLAIKQGKGFESPSRVSRDAQIEFWGSLPARLVIEYEGRLDEIHDGMDSLNVEELKEHIMNVHVPGRSRPSSAHSSFSTISAPPFTLMQLSDFTAVITATILRALPTLAKLNILLDSWSVRLLVLRQIPELLSSLEIARVSLDSALLSTQDSSQDTTIDLTSKREELIQVIGVAGSRMDTILDALEGRDDSMPDIWIDNMDALEADFATWVQQAERLAIQREWRSKSEEVAPTAVEDRESQRDVSRDHEEVADSTKEHDLKNLIEIPYSIEETLNTADTAIQSTSSSSQENSVSDLEPAVDPPTTTQDTVPTFTPENTDVPESSHPNNTSTIEPLILPASQPSPPESLSGSSILHTSTDTTKISQEKSRPSSPISISGSNSSYGKVIDEADIKNDQEVAVPMEETSHSLEISNQSSPEEIEPQLEQEESGLSQTEQLRSPPFPVINESDTQNFPEIQSKAILIVPEDETNPLQDPSQPISNNEENSMLAESLPTTTADSPAAQEIQCPRTPTEDSHRDDDTQTSENSDTDSHVLESEIIPSPKSISGDSENVPDGKLEKDHAQTTGDASPSISVLEPESDESSPQLLQSEGPTSVTAMPQVAEETPEEAVVEEIPKTHLEEPSAEELIPDSQPLDFLSERSVALNPDVPVQSIESPVEYNMHSAPLQNHDTIPLPASRTPSVEPSPAQDTATHFSPGLFSHSSDRTIREPSSSQLNSSMLHDLRTFQHSKNASLPLQRFIDDESDVNYSHPDLHSSSSREELSDVSPYSREDSEISRFRQRSESPPPNAIPRRAVRGPSSSLMRGTISSLNKVVGTTGRTPSDSSAYETSSVRISSRHRLGSPYDADSDSTPWRRKSSTSDLLQAPRSHLHNQPSMESIGSYASSNGTGRRRYSFSTDGGSFAIRPVHEADSDLQEKIHTILNGIPTKIRLSNNPAKDFDQQSMISSISSSKRSRITARSPFSTPSRAGTPNPSEGGLSSLRQRRTTSHKSEDKTVRVYHLHHRGKTEPTKLFVRTVGEGGERVMVRVGGGWADLGEYLREYVLHHGRQNPSSGNVVEVKGLPVGSTSPGSTASAATAIPNNSPGHNTSAISDRPGTSLSVRKTRRASKPSELPELAIDSVETTVDNLPLPSFPSGRRTSVSSLNSVSVSSILGDGSSVYSPHPGSARTPHHSVSTPLGLAGPKPRTRHVSMTPESEAWVEDVIGQARRTSSKPTPLPPLPKHNDQHHPINREALNSSRMSIRSVSDIPSVGRNKRVMLKGLGTHDRS